ncbi:MAG: hypothetical protein LUC20_09370, partial [Oscillospiraceae bacterium]|nr:hypothetical protein [Oscillospiraceae bacterium]
ISCSRFFRGITSLTNEQIKLRRSLVTSSQNLYEQCVLMGSIINVGETRRHRRGAAPTFFFGMKKELSTAQKSCKIKATKPIILCCPNY